MYGPDSAEENWPVPRRVTGPPVACTVVGFRRCWLRPWRLTESHTIGYMGQVHSDASDYGDIETLYGALVRVQR